MARTPDFEDMDPRDWPNGLRRLHDAAILAHGCMRDLDDATPTSDDDPKGYHERERLEMVELTGQAWALLKAIRTLGLTRLMEVETEANLNER